ncbi:MAG: hypothetical protein ACRDNO_28085 [Trebonia sp.]
MDEVSFGPEREIRLPPRYRRALAVVAAVVAAGAVTAGAALAVTTARAGNAASANSASSLGSASATAVAPLDRVSCPPVHATRPNLAALPAGMRPGALKIINDAQFSGRCGVSR